MNKNMMTQDKMAELKSKVSNWQVVEQEGVKKLTRDFEFDNFEEALAFTNRVGAVAEKENHHPKLVTEWGSVNVTWWSHEANGLQPKDFVMAASTDQQFKPKAAR